MKKELLEIIVCTDCKSELTLIAKEEDNEIKNGILRCRCGNEYRITYYIPCLINEEE